TSLLIYYRRNSKSSFCKSSGRLYYNIVYLKCKADVVTIYICRSSDITAGVNFDIKATGSIPVIPTGSRFATAGKATQFFYFGNKLRKVYAASRLYLSQ